MNIDSECFINLGNELYNNGLILSINNRIGLLDQYKENILNEIEEIDLILKKISIKINHIKLTSNSYSFYLLNSRKNKSLNDQSKKLNYKKKLLETKLINLETKLINVDYEYHSLNKKLNQLPKTFSLV
jgi:chromosome segregation ATPase